MVPHAVSSPFASFSWMIPVRDRSKPILRLITLFQGDLKFCNKICSSMGIVCFVNICTDAGSGTEKLICKGSAAVDPVTQTNHRHRKVQRFCYQSALSHRTTSPVK